MVTANTELTVSSLLFFFSLVVQKVPTSNTEGGWSFSLAEYVRHNDMPIYEASERVLRAFQDELMPAESLSEFCDVVGQYTCMHSWKPLYLPTCYQNEEVEILLMLFLQIELKMGIHL